MKRFGIFSVNRLIHRDRNNPVAGIIKHTVVNQLQTNNVFNVLHKNETINSLLTFVRLINNKTNNSITQRINGINQSGLIRNHYSTSRTILNEKYLSEKQNTTTHNETIYRYAHSFQSDYSNTSYLNSVKIQQIDQRYRTGGHHIEKYSVVNRPMVSVIGNTININNTVAHNRTRVQKLFTGTGKSFAVIKRNELVTANTKLINNTIEKDYNGTDTKPLTISEDVLISRAEFPEFRKRFVSGDIFYKKYVCFTERKLSEIKQYNNSLQMLLPGTGTKNISNKTGMSISIGKYLHKGTTELETIRIDSVRTVKETVENISGTFNSMVYSVRNADKASDVKSIEQQSGKKEFVSQMQNNATSDLNRSVNNNKNIMQYDIEMLTESVYKMLESKLRTERERRGILR